MDLSGLRVKISGPLLGKILHERHKFNGSCSGMLFGEVVSETKSEITDSDHVTKTSAHIGLQDYFPITSKSFLNMQSLKHKAWEEETYLPLSSCVGFFSIRSTGNSLSLLEKSMHRKLTKNVEMSNCGKHNQDIIVSLLINFLSNDDGTCLTWVINAFVYQNSEYKRIKIEVSNLQGSVSGSYLSNSGSVGNVESSSAGVLLKSFQTSLTDDSGRISIVEVTRNTTQKLMSKLDNAFENLQKNEKKLEESLSEKARLLSEWNSLTAKKKGKDASDIVCHEPTTDHANKNLQFRHKNEEKHNGDTSQYNAKTESEYQAVKRRSLEDIRRRSPIVVLEKIDSEKRGTNGNLHVVNNEIIDSEKKSVGNSSTNGASEVPFTRVVSSAESELKKDEAKSNAQGNIDANT